MKKLKLVILAAALGIVLSGCTLGGTTVDNYTQNNPISGGVTNNTDIFAPKTIESKDIESFYAHYYVYDEYDSTRDGICEYRIERNSEGQMILSASSFYKHEMELSEEALEGIQSIIDKYELVSKNGLDKVTAGLSPEYGPATIEVIYASEERLYVRENGDPEEPWALEMKAYIERLFIEAGFEDVKPPTEALTIKQFSLEFNVGNLMYIYGELGTNGTTVFSCLIYDLDAKEDVGENNAEITEELYIGLQEIIEEYDVFSLNKPETVSFSNPASGEGFVNIYVDYESGRQIYAEYGPDAIPEGWEEKRDALQSYLDTYIAEHLVTD